MVCSSAVVLVAAVVSVLVVVGDSGTSVCSTIADTPDGVALSALPV